MYYKVHSEVNYNVEIQLHINTETPDVWFVVSWERIYLYEPFIYFLNLCTST